MVAMRFFAGLEQLQNRRQIAGQLLVKQVPSVFVHESEKSVVAVQVNSDHDFHSGSPMG